MNTGDILREPETIRTDAICETEIGFVTDDGFPINATLYEGQPRSGNAPLLLVSSAAAVPRGFYGAFARFMVSRGCRAVLTYDYRGLPGSPTPVGWTRRLNMIDWGAHDFPAAAERLQAVAPGHPMVGVGHSYGGQALGISGIADRFDRYAAVATLSGYWRNTDEPFTVLLRMNALGVPLSLMLGSIPSWMGIGEPMPGSIFRDWARWCRMPDYFFDEKRLGMAARFERVTTPILSLGVKDDKWGTPAANAALMRHYVNAPVEQLWLGPRDANGQHIGHLGLFRRRFSDTLWPRLSRWLIDA